MPPEWFGLNGTRKKPANAKKVPTITTKRASLRPASGESVPAVGSFIKASAIAWLRASIRFSQPTRCRDCLTRGSLSSTPIGSSARPHGHKTPSPIFSGETASTNLTVQNTRDSPPTVTQNWATLMRSADVDQHITASSDAACSGRSNEVGVGGGVATTMLRMSLIVTVSAFKNTGSSLGAACVHRCSADSVASVEADAVGSVATGVPDSTIEVVVPAAL